MFKKFKDKLAEEMKQSPARLQASMQQLAQVYIKIFCFLFILMYYLPKIFMFCRLLYRRQCPTAQFKIYHPKTISV